MIAIYTTDKQAEQIIMKALRTVGPDKLDVTIYEMGHGTILEFGNWLSLKDVLAKVTQDEQADPPLIRTGPGGERYSSGGPLIMPHLKEIVESLTRRVNQAHNNLSSIMEYLGETSHNPEELYRMMEATMDDARAMDDPDPVREPPLVQTGPGGDFTRDYTPGRSVDTQA